MNTSTLNAGIGLDAEQQAFVALEAFPHAIAVIGPPGSGKTHALLHHVMRHTRNTNSLILTKGDPLPLFESYDRLEGRTNQPEPRIASFLEFAHDLFGESAQACGLPGPVTILSESAAFRRFCKLAQSLLDLDWPEFLSGDLDPEVSGLRNPDRFLATTFRLFERLRSADIQPEGIQESALRGTTTFYAAPPNFADTELLRATKDAYRDSLRVNFPALDHQRRREADLARIVGRLAHLQAEDSRISVTYGPQHALMQFTRCIEHNPALAERVRSQFPSLAIDEAQELTHLERRFLLSLYGPAYAGLICAGDVDATPGTHKSSSPRTFGIAATTTILHHRYRGNATLWNTHQLSLSKTMCPQPVTSTQNNGVTPVKLFRADDKHAETERVAAEFCARIAGGIAPERCALILRSLNCAWKFVPALLQAGIAIDFMGSINPLSEALTGDIHGLLWGLIDRKNSAAFLRIICSPLLALNDRSIALLCTKPGEPTLFALEPSSRERSARSPERIAANLLDGLNDSAFDSSTRRRLEAFRCKWQQWQSALRESDTFSIVYRIIRESGLLQGDNPHVRLARSMTARYLSLLEEHPLQQDVASSLASRLLALEESIKLDFNVPARGPIDPNALVITSVEAVRGHAFDVVAIPDARAGAFPRYYVPEAFLFSPTRGFVPRENVGGEGAGRTAKFTWYLHAVQARESYNREERKLFGSAIARANRELLISASGPATRGLTAPEFLEEVRRAGIPGVETITPH